MILPRSHDYEVGYCFECVLLSFEFFNWTGPFYLALVTSLAFYLSFFVFISAAQATLADFEVDVSTISHISKAWYTYLNPSSLQDWDI